eukprot:46424-Amorphochlora_amoeboformis.AAC.1
MGQSGRPTKGNTLLNNSSGSSPSVALSRGSQTVKPPTEQHLAVPCVHDVEVHPTLGEALGLEADCYIIEYHGVQSEILRDPARHLAGKELWLSGVPLIYDQCAFASDQFHVFTGRSMYIFTRPLYSLTVIPCTYFHRIREARGCKTIDI